MRHFDYTELEKKTWDNEIVNYLSLIHEYKGKQSVQPQELERHLKHLTADGYIIKLDTGKNTVYMKR